MGWVSFFGVAFLLLSKPFVAQTISRCVTACLRSVLRGREHGDCGLLCTTAQCSTYTVLQPSIFIPAGDVSAVQAQPLHPYAAVWPQLAWLCALYSASATLREAICAAWQQKGGILTHAVFLGVFCVLQVCFLLNTVMLC